MLSLRACPAARWLGFVALYALAWTVLPAVFVPAMPLDVVEGIAWGHEWQAGYYKHPSLPAWMLYPAYFALGKFGPYLLSQAAILLALFYVWKLACALLDRERAWLAAGLLYGIWYYSWPSIEFNHNVVQIPIWAALGWHYWKALQDQRWQDWVALGCWAGVGVWAKYTSLILLLCLGLHLLLSRQRRLLAQRGPWLALLVALLVTSPHVLWLLRHEAMPLVYMSQRTRAGTMSSAFVGSLRFLAAQLAMHLPLLLILLGSRVGRPCSGRHNMRPEAWHWLLLVALGPTLLVMLISVIAGGGFRDMWGMPMWNFSALLVLACLPRERVQARAPNLRRLLAVWMILVTLAMTLYIGFYMPWRGYPGRRDWPAAALATQARDLWQQQSSCPLRIVAGDYWLAGLTAKRRFDMASVLISGKPDYSPWITPQRLHKQGALFVWHLKDGENPTDPADLVFRKTPLLATTAQADWQVHDGQWQLSWPRQPEYEPLRIYWRSYVSPACIKQAVPDRPQENQQSDAPACGADHDAAYGCNQATP